MLIADFLVSNLLNGLFAKPMDCYSCRFSIQGTSVEMVYSELMRKVLIKLAICSIAFINGEIALFLLLIPPLLSSPAALGVTGAVPVSTFSSVLIVCIPVLHSVS